MEYSKRNQGSYNLHMIKTKNYKSITVKLYLREPIKKEAVTMRNVLNEMLFLSSKKYPSKKELTKALQNLYAANIHYHTRRLGTYLDTSYTLKVLNDKYTEDKNFEKSVELFSSLLFEPKVEENAFMEEEFQTVYEEMKASLLSLKENKERYALVRLLEEVDQDSEVAIRSIGYLEDLEEVTREKLYTYYKEMMEHNLVDIFILGDFKEEEVVPIFKKYFPFSTFKPKRHSAFSRVGQRSKPNLQEEVFHAKQSQLAMACSVCNLTPYERNYPLSLYNTILGGGGASYLFQEVREKSSLAYYISSSPNKFDDLILIQGGITSSKEGEAIKIIEKQLKRLAKGDFSSSDLEKAKEYFTTALDDIWESPLQMIESYYMMEVLGVDDLETKRKKMLKVTKEEVVSVAKKVKIHTIFCLKGEENETL